MRRHRVHLPHLEAGISVLTGREAAHLAQVLRVSPGSAVRAFDGRGSEANGVVREVGAAGRVVLELEAPGATQVEADIDITVVVSLLKGDKLTGVVRQCTELGARTFRLVLTSRRDVPELSRNKLERLRRVAQEAAKQSGRAFIPEVHEPVALDALVWGGAALIAHPGATTSLAQLPPADSVTVITGPEGGFGDGEVEELESRGAVRIGLGARVLRAETAPVALVAALLVPEAR